MTDPLAAARARLAHSPDSPPGVQEWQSAIDALLVARSNAEQYRSDRDVLRRQLAERDATIAMLRADLTVLKRPAPLDADGQVVPGHSAPGYSTPGHDAPGHAATDEAAARDLLDALDALKTLVEQAIDAGAGRRYHHLQTRRGGFLSVAPLLERAAAALAAARTPAGMS